MTRFDICNAFYVFAVNFHSGQFSPEYAILGQLLRMGYSPGLTVQNGGFETAQAEILYHDLVAGRVPYRLTRA